MNPDPKIGDSPVPSALGHQGALTVLVVEDEPSVARVTTAWLTRMGCHVLESANGREADALASQYTERIDLLLADVMLPGMRGPVLAGAIHRRHPETAVLFTSGYSPELVSELFAAHVDTAMLLHKPYTSAQLGASMKLVLARKAAATASSAASSSALSNGHSAESASESGSTDSERRASPALRR